MKKKLIMLLLGSIILVSCSNPVMDKKAGTTPVSFIPYAQELDLENYLLQENIVNYKTMRVVALMELKQNYKTFGFEQNDTLSEYPVAILNEETDLPDYYEFTVLRNGENVGYITTVANKKLGEPVQFISSEPTNYSKTARLTLTENLYIYNSDYPNTKVVTESQRSVSTGEYKNTKTNRESFLEYLSYYTEAELNEYGYTREELILDYDSRIADENERLSNLWYELEADEENLLMLDDEIITARAVTYLSYDDNNWRLQFLKPWVDLSYNFNGATTFYCGPTALAIVLYGYNSSVSLLKYVDKIVAAGLKDEGAVYYPGMNSALKDVTNNVLRLGYHAGHKYNHTWEDLAENKLPVLSLRTGIGNEQLGWHYRVIIGMAQKNENSNGAHKWEKYTTSDYYYMADNGADSINGSDKPYTIYGYNYQKGGQKFWEKAKENGTYFQHFPVMYK